MCTSRLPVAICRHQRQLGVTLIELIVFMVIVGVGVIGLLSVTNSTIMHSADPMLRKQALAIAESLLLEIEQRPFTWCDPSDANALTATSAAGCATTPEVFGPEAGESRYSNSNPFDNVNDYAGFAMPDASCAGICALGDAAPIAALAGYAATVSVVPAGADLGLADPSAALKITVTVSGQNESIALVGYRTRYAPNAGG